MKNSDASFKNRDVSFKSFFFTIGKCGTETLTEEVKQIVPQKFEFERRDEYSFVELL